MKRLLYLAGLIVFGVFGLVASEEFSLINPEYFDALLDDPHSLINMVKLEQRKKTSELDDRLHLKVAELLAGPNDIKESQSLIVDLNGNSPVHLYLMRSFINLATLHELLQLPVSTSINIDHDSVLSLLLKHPEISTFDKIEMLSKILSRKSFKFCMDVFDRDGDTLLMLVCRMIATRDQCKELVRILVQGGANLNAPCTAAGNYFIIYFYNDADMLAYLIELGADVNVADRHGTVLHACMGALLELARGQDDSLLISALHFLLVESDIDRNLKNESGFTAYKLCSIGAYRNSHNKSIPRMFTSFVAERQAKKALRFTRSIFPARSKVVSAAPVALDATHTTLEGDLKADAGV